MGIYQANKKDLSYRGRFMSQRFHNIHHVTKSGAPSRFKALSLAA
jgi:hypothetical protein